MANERSIRPNYYIELKIGEWDYTNTVQRCRIVGSAASKYYAVVFELLTKGDYITDKEEFFSSDILLSIKQVDIESLLISGETIDMKLMCIKVDGLDLKQRSQSNEKNEYPLRAS